MADYRQIVQEYCGVTLTAGDTSCCPFAGQLHDTATGDRAVKWTFPADGGKPHAHCFHAKCQDAWHELMRGLYRAILAAERGERATGAAPAGSRRSLPEAPKAAPARAVKCDPVRAAALAAHCRLPEITADMLRRISPVPIPEHPAEHGALLIDTLYKQGEHILVFTHYASQGQYLHTAGTREFYRLGNRPGIKARRSPRLPLAGREGVWYLTAPVLGTWQPNPNKRGRGGVQLLGRRHTACCTRFPYLVLESDEIPPATWLRILAQLRERIAAIYSSGGKSIHTLLRVDAATVEEFNLHRANIIRRLCCVGADPAAITPVRLSRLPGCLRLGKVDPTTGAYTEHPDPPLQELYYLDPAPTTSSTLEQKILARLPESTNSQKRAGAARGTSNS